MNWTGYSGILTIGVLSLLYFILLTWYFMKPSYNSWVKTTLKIVSYLIIVGSVYMASVLVFKLLNKSPDWKTSALQNSVLFVAYIAIIAVTWYLLRGLDMPKCAYDTVSNSEYFKKRRNIAIVGLVLSVVVIAYGAYLLYSQVSIVKRVARPKGARRAGYADPMPIYDPLEYDTDDYLGELLNSMP